MRILIVDDHELVRAGVRSLLLSHPGFDVCGEAVDGWDAVQKAAELRPDAVVMDITMPGLNGLAATREIRRTLAETEVVILSQDDTGEMKRHALKAGAAGYVVKSTISADLIAALRKIRPQEAIGEPTPVEGALRLSQQAQQIAAAHPDLLKHEGSQEASPEGEPLFRRVLDTLPVPLYATDADGHLTYFNPAATEFSGRTPELGTDRWCVSWKMYRQDGSPLPHDECPMAIALKEGLILDGFEAIVERPDGTRRWFLPYPRLLCDSEGTVLGGINLLFDITERRQSEQAKNLLAAIVDSSDDAIVSKNLDGIVTSWNRGAERLFGYTAAEAIGHHITLIIPPDRLHEEMTILARLRRGERIDHFETVRMRKDRQPVHISLTISPLKDADGHVIGASKVARDITERKLAEESLLRSEARLRALSEKLESEVQTRTQELQARNAELTRKSEQLRELSWRLLRVEDDNRRRIARELHDSAGQILTVIGMNLAALLPEAQRTSPTVAGSVAEIQRLVQQLHQEIRTTSYLLHPPLLDEVGLPAAIHWYTEGLAQRSGLEIDLQIPEPFDRLPDEMELAIYRLVQECLTNVHRHSESKSAAIRISVDAETLRVEVQDRGKGISPERLAEVQSKGSGVGLQGMRERLGQFRGEVSIESSPSGTTVVATIPISKQAAPSRLPSGTGTKPPAPAEAYQSAD